MAAVTAELDWMATQLQTIRTYIDVAGPEALSLPQTVLSPNGWPSSRHTHIGRESRQSVPSECNFGKIWPPSRRHTVLTGCLRQCVFNLAVCLPFCCSQPSTLRQQRSASALCLYAYVLKRRPSRYRQTAVREEPKQICKLCWKGKTNKQNKNGNGGSELASDVGQFLGRLIEARRGARRVRAKAQFAGHSETIGTIWGVLITTTACRREIAPAVKLFL